MNTRPRHHLPQRLTAIAKKTRVVLIISEFHGSIARALVRGATEVLRRGGVAQANIRLVWVPGAFELPGVASRVARTAPRPAAIVALGALIRGETPQYEVIAHAVAHGLTTVAVETGIPVTFGVIVATTMAQAKARAGSQENRGAEAARAALSLIHLVRRPPSTVHRPQKKPMKRQMVFQNRGRSTVDGGRFS